MKLNLLLAKQLISTGIHMSLTIEQAEDMEQKAACP